MNYDIIVIGAGMAGASVAAHLAPTGRVLVLEQESHPGMHATGRSAALFSTIYGPEPVRALSRASQSTLMSPSPAFSEEPFATPRGVLYIATDEQAPRLRVFQAAPDVAAMTRIVSPEEALALCPIIKPDRLAANVLEPDAADLDVHRLHQAYLRQLRAHGGELLTDHPVGAIKRDGAGWSVSAGGANHTAPILINAAGAWGDQIASLAGVTPLGLRPLRRTVILVDAPDGMDIAKWPMVIDADEDFYFKPDAGRLLITPADESPSPPCDAQPEEWDIAVAVDRVETATSLRVRRVSHRWAGLRTFAPDGVPVAGYDPEAPGFFWLVGQGGYGIQTAPALSQLAASMVLWQSMPASLEGFGIDPAELSPMRFRRT